jgi:hypothetical protein
MSKFKIVRLYLPNGDWINPEDSLLNKLEPFEVYAVGGQMGTECKYCFGTGSKFMPNPNSDSDIDIGCPHCDGYGYLKTERKHDEEDC